MLPVGIMVDFASSLFRRVLLLALAAALALPPARAGGALPPEDLVRALRQARVAEREGRTQDALALLRQAAKEHPESIAPVLALWEHHGKHGLPENEAREFRKILVRRLADPGRPLPPGSLSYLTETSESTPAELEVVIDAATRRLAATPDDYRLTEAVALLQLRLGRREAARASLDRLLVMRPSNRTRWRRLELDRELGRWDDAANLLREMVEGPDDSPFARALYLEALGKAGRLAELLAQLEHVVQGPGLDAMTRRVYVSQLLQTGWDLYDLGRHDDSEKLFRRVLAIDPANVPARTAILFLFSSEEERAAHESLLRSRWEREEDPAALLDEGANLLASGNDREAYDLLKRASSGLSDSDVAWFNLGVAALKLEKWSEAETAFAKAAALRPGRAEAHFNRGAALQRLDRCEEAVRQLDRALALDPDLVDAHYYLYACHKALGNLAAARKHFEIYERR